MHTEVANCRHRFIMSYDDGFATIRALWAECQSVPMSKLMNNGLTRYGTGTGCFVAVSVWQQWASKG